MNQTREGDLLWTPTAERKSQANITRYMAWLRDTRGLHFASYDDLWRWSVEDLEAFWGSIWDYFDIKVHKPSRAGARRPEHAGREVVSRR